LSDKGRGWRIAAIAVAALVVGFAASSLAYRYRLLHVPHEPIIVRMQRELNLTFSQREQVRQVIEETRFQIITLRQQFQRERLARLREAFKQIRALLNPEQQEKFDREFKPPPLRSLTERYGPHGPHGPPPPPAH
jgi:uncharacterized membrane protein YccC